MKTEVFSMGLSLLKEAFPNRQINAKIYFEALKDLTDEQFEGSVLKIVQKTAKLYPDDNLIAILRDNVMGSTEDQAVIAWTVARQAILSYGYYKTVSFEDKIINGVIAGMGGWEKFSSILLEEEPFRQKDFVSLYEAISRSERDCPERLPGYFERINGHPEKTILIADSKKNQKLLGVA